MDACAHVDRLRALRDYDVVSRCAPDVAKLPSALMSTFLGSTLGHENEHKNRITRATFRSVRNGQRRDSNYEGQPSEDDASPIRHRLTVAHPRKPVVAHY